MQRQSGNPKIQPDSRGSSRPPRYVTVIEVPQRLDRSLGDVHAAGNPHIHLDPRNIARVADSARRAHGKHRSRRCRHLPGAGGSRFSCAGSRRSPAGRAQAAPLRGMPVVVHHKDMTYLLAWLGMREVGSLEPKPGLPADAPRT